MPNKNNNNITLVSTFKKGSLLVVVTTAILMSLIILYQEFYTFSKHAELIESQYITEKKQLLKREVLRVTEYIAREREHTQAKIKNRIKERTYEAHAIATNIFNKFKGKLPEQKIKKLIIEALRPLRFFNNTGYYFIHSLDGVLQLHAKRPNLEGTNRLNFKNSAGQYVVKDLFNIITKSGEGYSSYKYPSFDNSGKDKSKYTFVKHFKPYNWSIATGDYLENVEKDIQEDILEHIEHINFGENSYMFVVNYDGKTLMHHRKQHYIGKNISNLIDKNGVNLYEEQRKAVKNPEGDFIYYVWTKPSTSSPADKMTFVKGVPDWQWMIGTGVYIDDIQDTIQQQRSGLIDDLVIQIIFILIIVLTSGFFIIHISNKYTQRITAELGLFLSFFTNVSEKTTKIKINTLHFIEFKNLAEFANRMLDKKIEVEKSLRTSEENLKAAQRITHFGSWEYDILTKTIQWSDEVFNIFNLDKSTTTPSYENFILNIHPDDRENTVESYNEAIKKKEPFDIEHRIKTHDGIIKFVREHAETYYDDNGVAIHSSGTIQDITEIKEKEEQLKRTQKMDALGKLTGGIAHDYNNMMGVVLGYSDLLRSQVEDNKKASKYVTQIHEAGERAKVLTDKLMAFSRYKSSETEVVNINEQLQRQEQLLEKTLTARIKLELKLEDELWLTKIDPGDFNDTIINMAINTSHAIDTNGSMIISTYNTHLSPHDAGLLELPVDYYVVVSLADSGNGMDEETLSKIFDPFFSTKGDKGTGLGLSQVYGFTKRSGGSIKVTSELGQGSEFKLYFPRYHANVSADKSDENVNITTTKHGNETILIVDDEEPLCDMAGEILHEQGYHVLKAQSAQQALSILETETVDLVFSDIIMPEMTGYELAEAIIEKYPNILIQLTSGYNDVKNLNLDIDISNMNILTKPYSRQDLLNKLRELFDSKSLVKS